MTVGAQRLQVRRTVVVVVAIDVIQNNQQTSPSFGSKTCRQGLYN